MCYYRSRIFNGEDAMNNIKTTAAKLTLLLLISFPAQIIISFAAGLIPQSGISSNMRDYIIPQILYPLLFEVPYLLIAKKSLADFMPTPARKVSARKTLSAAFAFMLAAIMTSSIYAGFLDTIKIIKPIRSSSFEANNAFEAVLWIIALAVLPPILEEAVFRGAILGTMRQYMGKGAIFFSAALFALMHANFNQIPIAFALGLILGWFAYSTGSIVVPIILHACNNLSSVIFGLLKGVLPEALLKTINSAVTLSIVAIGIFCTILEIKALVKTVKEETKEQTHPVKTVFLSPAFIFYAALMLGLAVLTNFVG